MDALALLPHLVHFSHREIPCALQGKLLGISKAQASGKPQQQINQRNGR